MTDLPIVGLELAPPSIGTGRTGARRLARELLRSGTALVGLIVLLVIAAMAIFAPLIAPHDPTQIDLLHRLAKPVWMGGSWNHPLGTDGLGHDELSLLVYGARVSMTTGVIVILAAGGLGSLLGIMAGYYGGWRDAVIMRLVDTSIAFPGLLLALIVLVMVGPGETRRDPDPQRAQLDDLRARQQRDRAQPASSHIRRAAETVGCSGCASCSGHLLPNLASTLLTVATLEFAAVVLSEASLSYPRLRHPAAEDIVGAHGLRRPAVSATRRGGSSRSPASRSRSPCCRSTCSPVAPGLDGSAPAEQTASRAHGASAGEDWLPCRTSRSRSRPRAAAARGRAIFASTSRRPGTAAHAVRDVEPRRQRAARRSAIVGESGSGKSVTAPGAARADPAAAAASSSGDVTWRPSERSNRRSHRGAGSRR